MASFPPSFVPNGTLSSDGAVTYTNGDGRPIVIYPVRFANSIFERTPTTPGVMPLYIPAPPQQFMGQEYPAHYPAQYSTQHPVQYPVSGPGLTQTTQVPQPSQTQQTTQALQTTQTPQTPQASPAETSKPVRKLPPTYVPTASVPVVQQTNKWKAKTCCGPGRMYCSLCFQKERHALVRTHCDECCGFCEYCNKYNHKQYYPVGHPRAGQAWCLAQFECEECGKKGHSKYYPEGHPREHEIWCFALIACERCGGTGHTADTCPRKICELCREKNKPFLGHTSNECFSNRTCETCGMRGHTTERCRTCTICKQSSHTTEQCEAEVMCDLCGKLGHSSQRCNICKICGHWLGKPNDKRGHYCRRDEYMSCKQCGAYGTGRCECYDHVAPHRKG